MLMQIKNVNTDSDVKNSLSLPRIATFQTLFFFSPTLFLAGVCVLIPASSTSSAGGHPPPPPTSLPVFHPVPLVSLLDHIWEKSICLQRCDRKLYPDISSSQLEGWVFCSFISGALSSPPLWLILLQPMAVQRCCWKGLHDLVKLL